MLKLAPGGHGARIQISGLTKRYGDVVALAPTDVTIEPGEFFSLIGPSGSGKSTLLGNIAGFIPPTAGVIEIDGTDVVSIPPYRRNIGMVFQNYALFPHMTVFENIAFPLRLRKLAQPDIDARVTRMLHTVRLPDLGGRMPSQLSGGQQQRIALARAAAYDPRVLLMDEPLGALDKNLREQLQYEIKQFHTQIGATIVYVTHDQDEAAAMSDRIAIMRDGRIVQVGRPRELYERPRNAFVASFLGEANLFDVSALRNGHDGLALVETVEGITFHAPKPPGSSAGSYVACIRPETISLATNAPTNRRNDINIIEGHITDVVYTAGTVRYRVDASHRGRLTVKLASQRNAPLHEQGSRVALVCAASDVLLIPKE
jgi:putative spermidine/putrescine transport system ATP-binding protein